MVAVSIKLARARRDTMDTSNVLLVFAFAFVVLMPLGMKEADAANLSFTVIPTEARRVGITQRDPCAGDTLNFDCALSGSSTAAVRWRVNESVIYTLVISDDLGMSQDSVIGMTATLVNETLSTLQIRLADPGIMNVMNETVVECQEIGGVSQSTNVTIIGPASAPTVSVRRNSLSRLVVDMTAPVYGRECVDSYRALAVVGGVTLPPIEQQVMDPTQEVYTLEIQGVDLCRDTLTSVTAVGVTDGVEGAMATPVAVDNIDRTTIINSTVMSSQVFATSGVNFLLTWQVVDDGIETNGFQVTCFKEGDPISCEVQGTTATERTAVIPSMDDLIGKNFTFRVNYSYEMCVSDSFSTSVQVANVLTSTPPVSSTTMPPSTNTSSGNKGGAIGGGVGGTVAAVSAGVFVCVIAYVVAVKHKKKKGKRDDKGDGGEDNTDDGKLDLATYADPNSIEHQQAPSGEEYAMVARPAKNNPEVSAPLYQDPNTIQHQEAAGGDLYTVVDKPKKGSKKAKESSVDQAAPMYSVPDKSRKNNLTYADIDLPRGAPIPSQDQTEYSSLVN